jgi:hypothetical protein
MEGVRSSENLVNFYQNTHEIVIYGVGMHIVYLKHHWVYVMHLALSFTEEKSFVFTEIPGIVILFPIILWRAA